MQSKNKNVMQTIFEVSIQPTAGYLVNYHLSNHEVSKLYCNHMTSKSSVTCCLQLPIAMLGVHWNSVPVGTLICESFGSGRN